MRETTFKISGNGIEFVVPDGVNKSVIKTDENGTIHISAEKITVCDWREIMDNNKIFMPHQLKTIEIDVEKKIFRVNGEDFGKNCTGFSIYLDTKDPHEEWFHVTMDISEKLRFCSTYNIDGNKTSENTKKDSYTKMVDEAREMVEELEERLNFTNELIQEITGGKISIYASFSEEVKKLCPNKQKSNR